MTRSIDLSALENLGKYMLRGELGRGAMGVVYDGWDPAIDRRVAIKTVRLAEERDAEILEALARFKRGAQAAGRLEHPNIVGVYDYGETPHCAYIVMEFVEGRSLKSLLDQETQLPPAEAGAIMAQVLAGLAYSHSRGVIHRDIKPANIMLTTDSQVKIADFGVARIESSDMTSVGTMIGTPAYMPPEQFLGEPADARADIYAAGIMLFHLLTGKRPYEGKLNTIMQQVLSPDPPPLASARAHLPTIFDGVIARAMAKAPAARYATATEFAEALRTALQATAGDTDADATLVAPSRAPGQKPLPVSALEETLALPRPPLPGAGGSRRSRLVIGLGAAAALLLLASGAALVLLRGKPPAPVTAADKSAPSLAMTTEPRAVPPGAVSPSTPAQPASPRPAVSPPTLPRPAEPAADRQAALQSALSALPCNTLWARTDKAGITVTGLVGSGYEAAARAAAGTATPVTWAAQTLPASYCGALEGLRVAPGAGMAANTLDVALGGTAGRAHLVFGSPIEPSVTAADFPAWLTVDYLSNNGTVSHVRFKGTTQTVMLAPGETLRLKAAQTGCLGPPYGTDLIIAIAASPNLRPDPRPALEKTADYLVSLKQALLDASQQGGRVAIGTMAVDTERGQPGPDAGMRYAVANPNSRLYSKPSPRAPSRLLPDCEVLTVTDHKNAWFAVRVGDDSGWLPEGDVTQE